MMYLYSAFYESTVSGLPVSRSLVIDHAHDPAIYDARFENQYLFGQSILVAPHESNKEITKVYLPKGEWYDFFTNELHQGGQEIFSECPLNKIPLYVKGSAILPVTPDIGNSTQELGSTLEWHIFKGQAENTFVYYEDDGTTFDNETGDFHTRTITYNPSDKKLIFNKKEGAYKSKFTKHKLVLHGFNNSHVSVNGKETQLDVTDYRFVDPIPSFDPLFTEIDESLDTKGIRETTISLTEDKLEISL